MQYILISYGTAGDIFPYLALAQALRQAGHEVQCIATPNMAPHAAQLGVPFHALMPDADYQAALDAPQVWDVHEGFYCLWRYSWPWMQRLPALLQQLAANRDTLLVCHPFLVPAMNLWRERQTGVRAAALFLAPSNLRTLHDPLLLGEHRVPAWFPFWLRRMLWRAGERKVHFPQMLADLNQARAALGLPLLSDLIGHFADGVELALGMFPDWFGPAKPDWPAHFMHAGFPLHNPDAQAALPPALQAFLQQGAAPLLFTPGSAYRHGRRYFDIALEVLRRNQQRAIFLTASQAHLPPLPPSVFWQDFVPLSQLLPHVSWLLHHGGIGTCAEGMAAGVPQIAIPCAYDQFDNGARLQALGVGWSLPMRRLSAKRLLALLAQPPAHCRQIAARMASAPSSMQNCLGALAQLAARSTSGMQSHGQ
ncbi:glycosyltransferase [Massilia sp. W12]|uniref:glycosyltransferase n=1 Tax=Massilia sp. W12 TaxID=3126507 RepID=UPI0030CD1609